MPRYSFRLWAIGLTLSMALSPVSYADAPAGETSTPAAPAVPPSAKPETVTVDLAKVHSQTDFKPEVTQDQRVHVHIDLGKVFEARGNFDAALAEYQHALEACDRKGLARFRSDDLALVERRIAGALDRLGRFSQAEVHYKKAIRLSPRDPKIWNDAGYSYYLQGRWTDAERALKTALRYAPEDPRITANLGLTLAAAGRASEALPLLSRYTGDANGHANLGYLLAATGQTELARDQYLQALALSPNFQLAQRALAQLDRARTAGPVAKAETARPETPSNMTAAKAPSGDREVRRTSQTREPIPPPRQFTLDAAATAKPKDRGRGLFRR